MIIPMAYDFIAIGDTVSDEFIELEDVRIDTKRDEGDKGYKGRRGNSDH
jgi:hypothetical protein